MNGIKSRLILGATLAVFSVLAGCEKEAAVPDETSTAILATTETSPSSTSTPASASPVATKPPKTLECENLGFPCTWDEVPAETMERTRMFGEIASLLSVTASQQEVADFLLEQPDISYVELSDTGVRFRVDGGGPAWVYPPSEMDHHRPAAASPTDDPVAATPADLSTEPPQTRHSHHTDHHNNTNWRELSGRMFEWLSPTSVYAQSSGVGSHGVAAKKAGGGKKALILSPFEWEWLEKSTTTNGEELAVNANFIRDYQSEHGGEVILHSDLFELEGPKQGPQQNLVRGEVQFEDYLGWDKKGYSIIIVATHGDTRECSQPSPMGGKANPNPLSNPVPTKQKKCPLIFAGRHKQSDYGSYVGVELIFIRQPKVISHPGLSPTEARQCAIDVANWQKHSGTPPEPSTSGGKPCRQKLAVPKHLIALWTSFFEDQYDKGLNNMFLFLAACHSGVNNVLPNQFAQSGNEKIVVFGFDAAVDAGAGFGLAKKMLVEIRLGLENREILKQLRISDLTSTGHLVGRSMDLGDDPLPEKPAEILEASKDLTHGRDIVMLVSPAGSELTNGASVRVETGNEQTDLLDLHAQIIGLDADTAKQLHLKVQVVDEAVPNTYYQPTNHIEQWVDRATGKVSLGRKFEEGEKVDLEVSVEFPGGYNSRWVYKDITLTGSSCSWSASVSGETPAQGGFFGTHGNVLLKDQRRPPFDTDAVVQDDDPQPEAPWMVINLNNIDRSRLTDPAFVSAISFAIPGIKPGQTGSWKRVWGSISIGTESFKGNADYLRRDLVGLPEGSGIGNLLTSNVTLSRNDAERIEGSFEARFINQNLYHQLDNFDQHPLGVGVHPITKATISARGEFSLQAPAGCRNTSFRRSIRDR